MKHIVKGSKLFFAFVIALTVLSACQNEDIQSYDKSKQVSKNVAVADPIPGQESINTMILFEEIENYISSANYDEALQIIASHLSDPGIALFLAEYKAEILLLQGNDSFSLDVYMDLINGVYGHWNHSFFDLENAFALAETLDREPEIDQIAQLLIENQRVTYFDYAPLQVPTTAANANERLAYAYLALALSSRLSDDTSKQMVYIEKAFQLMPSSTLVLVHKAAAVHSSQGIPGNDECKSLLLQAYNQESGDPEMQAEIVGLARLFRTVPFP